MMSLAQIRDSSAAPETSSNLFDNLTSASNLSSNNPFRNQTVSTFPTNSIGKPLSPPTDTLIYSASRNPFLPSVFKSKSISTSPLEMPSVSEVAKPRSQVNSDAAAIFEKMTLKEKSDQVEKSHVKSEKLKSDRVKANVSPSRTSRPSHQRENLPPSAVSSHRLRKSNEEVTRNRRNGTGSSSKFTHTGDSDVFADPPSSRTSSRKPEERKPRRNSDSSAIERPGKSTESEEDKKRQERKRREKKQRDYSEKDPRSRRPNRKLDVIDKLDVTSIYGTGLFHHDGPFDACNPHRNRQGSKRAPMQAFPEDSLNNVLGGGGPINKRPDHAVFMGNKDEEAFNDYSKGGTNANDTDSYDGSLNKLGHLRQESNVLSATTRVEPIHGEETLGLGTSTFLEGAPASKNAMQRRASLSMSVEPTLSRSKSFAQKFRGINVPRRDLSSRITSSDGILSPEMRTPVTGKTERSASIFFDETFKTEESVLPARKESTITIKEPEKIPTQSRMGNVPRLSVPSDYQISDANTESPSGKTGIGFMSRVKSLKGGGRKMKTSAIES